MVAWLLEALVLAMAAASQGLADEPDWSQVELLRKKLLENYDRYSLPQRDVNGTTTVGLSLYPVAIWIEEERQVLCTNAWMNMVWHDPRLTWDYKDYGNVKQMHMATQDVWLPEIYLYNNVDISQVEHYGNVNTLVNPDGKVTWIPPVSFRSECRLDFAHWPFDSQRCDLYIGTWTHHGLEVNLELISNDTRIYRGMTMKNSHSWTFVDGFLKRHVIRYLYNPTPYIMIQAVVTMERTSPMFNYTVVIPAIVISLLTLLQFVLPLREPRRLTLGCTSLLLTLLMLLYLAMTIPALSTSLPIIVKYFGQTLVVVLASVATVGVVLRLTDGRHPAATTPPPQALKTLLMGRLSTVLFLQKYTEKVGLSGGGEDDGQVLEETQQVTYIHEWLLLAAAVDRIAFGVFIATFFITLIDCIANV